MSDIQRSMMMLITAYHKYSRKEGDPLTLTKSELKNMLQAEMGEMFRMAKDQTAVDKIFKDLDRDGKKMVDFKEYINCVSSLTMLSNEFFWKK